MTTFVISSRMSDAIRECRDHRLSPRSRDVVLVTPSRHVSRLPCFGRGDRVLWGHLSHGEDTQRMLSELRRLGIYPD